VRRELRRPRRRRPPRRPRALARARAASPAREGRPGQGSRPAYRMTPGRSTGRAGLALVANAGAAVVMHATILQPCEARPVDSTAEPFGQMTERVEDPPRSKVRILHAHPVWTTPDEGGTPRCVLLHVVVQLPDLRRPLWARHSGGVEDGHQMQSPRRDLLRVRLARTILRPATTTRSTPWPRVGHRAAR
jgi:hypothetical protein